MSTLSLVGPSNPGYRATGFSYIPPAAVYTKIAQGYIVFLAHLLRQSNYIYPLTRKSQVRFSQVIQPGYDVLNKLTIA